ncbi:MAG: hypothetical protein K8L99_10340, partial [Anaerolineae bacterium]|nr:hypothetical protein [Anaerolineae bacterium]
DEVTLNAQQDLEAITTLEAHQVADYIQARPYLCHLVCGSPKKVAEGYINPDGKFSICWLDSLGFTTANCHSEYAYVVKQKFGNIWLTIYNGVTANKWYDYGDVANLISYHPLAQTCRVNDFPGEGAFVVLQDIGDAHSYRLKTPNADAWNSVASPAYNDGLADPVNNPGDALGQLKNRNWGGTLKLLYAFREEMRSIGARYYRISVREADSNGNPTGSRVYLSDGLSWKKFTGGGDVEAVTLGPTTVGGQSNLYTIPFDADADWQDNQYHGYLNTTQFDRGRHLLTLEVFDGSGRLMRPTGTTAPSGEPDLPTSVEAAFTFRRWYQEFGPTAVVPYAALTHMFWWDNRKAEAVIVDLRKNGSASEAECQFLEGDGSSTFSVGYRAYHEEPMFLLNHSLWWKRGLGGATRYLVDASPTNVGAPPSGVGVSPTHTFDYMLSEGTDEPLDKCSFALNLYVNVKTFNGEGTLDSLDDWDYASFALEISE